MHNRGDGLRCCRCERGATAKQPNAGEFRLVEATVLNRVHWGAQLEHALK
jgi:hypothetical protein